MHKKSIGGLHEFSTAARAKNVKKEINSLLNQCPKSLFKNYEEFLSKFRLVQILIAYSEFSAQILNHHKKSPRRNFYKKTLHSFVAKNYNFFLKQRYDSL